ncbi:hypothetical protein BASA50_000371 [Batrachochytrium salamandrivorans]|uniref:F-box domain-containing protein n=1 Tax=Batrachochytrium salamandrivorans TaxID=1357716 RepID=A0ABQ8EUC0_9FUNG|nr:hypothetical protein BASA50_000371 [Batrachochytrium salamandrivorans]
MSSLSDNVLPSSLIDAESRTARHCVAAATGSPVSTPTATAVSRVTPTITDDTVLTVHASAVATLPSAHPTKTLSPRLQSTLSAPHKYSRLATVRPIDPLLCFINQLPDEILIHLLAVLQVDDMKKAVAVCQRWKSVLSDDLCWKAAFRNYFGGFPFRRLIQKSWRDEYLERLSLARIWHRCGQGVQFNSGIGRIDQIFVDDANGRVYLGYLQGGIVSICNATTGKVERAAISCFPTNTPMRVGAIKFDRHRIAVGHMNGSVGIMTNFCQKGQPSRRIFTGHHTAPVICIIWVADDADLIVSGSEDGEVRVWSMSMGRCIGVLNGDGFGITHLHITPSHSIVAGTKAGKGLIWDMSAIMASRRGKLNPPSGSDIETQQDPLLVIQPSLTINCGQQPIQFMIYDALTHTVAVVTGTSGLHSPIHSRPLGEGSDLIHRTTPQLAIWSATTGEQIVAFSVPPPFADITSLVWDVPQSAGSESRTTLLAVGDVCGSLHLWKVPDLTLSPLRTIPNLVPWRSAISLHGTPISQLLLDGHKMISNSTDGKIKVLDVMSGDLLCRVSLKLGHTARGGLAAGDVGRESIHFIWAGERSLIACAHQLVGCWSFGRSSQSETSFKKKSRGKTHRRTSTAARGAGAIGGRYGRGALAQVDPSDLYDDVFAIRQEIEAERFEHAHHIQRRNEYNGNGQLQSNMTEDELLHYVLMLSVEQLEADEVMRAEADAASALSISATSKLSLAETRSGQASSSLGTTSSHSSSRRLSHKRYDDGDDWDDETDSIDPEAAEYLSPQCSRQQTMEVALDMDELDLSGSGRQVLVGGGSTSRNTGGSVGGDWPSVSRMAQRIPTTRAGVASYSPSLRPLYPGGHHQPTGNVVVSPRPSQQDEDDELMYVLELSRLEAEEAVRLPN